MLQDFGLLNPRLPVWFRVLTISGLAISNTNLVPAFGGKDLGPHAATLLVLAYTINLQKPERFFLSVCFPLQPWLKEEFRIKSAWLVASRKSRMGRSSLPGNREKLSPHPGLPGPLDAQS
jgi:hypothetical protein